MERILFEVCPKCKKSFRYEKKIKIREKIIEDTMFSFAYEKTFDCPHCGIELKYSNSWKLETD